MRDCFGAPQRRRIGPEIGRHALIGYDTATASLTGMETHLDVNDNFGGQVHDCAASFIVRDNTTEISNIPITTTSAISVRIAT